MTVPVTTSGKSLRIHFTKNPEEDGYDPADDLRAENSTDAEPAADGLQRGHIGKARTHDHRKARADPSEDREELQQRRHPSRG